LDLEDRILKKILSVVIISVLLFSNSVFAQENTSEITGTIQVSIIDVDIPTTASFIIDPNRVNFVAPELYITNNSTMPISVSISEFDNKVGTDNQFTEVAKYDKVWRNLDTTESRTYIYLGIGPEDIYQEGYVEGRVEDYMFSANDIQGSSAWIAAIRPGYTVTLDMESSFGRAMSGAFTTTYELVFIVEVMD
jgi:hypothetical protein